MAGMLSQSEIESLLMSRPEAAPRQERLPADRPGSIATPAGALPGDLSPQESAAADSFVSRFLRNFCQKLSTQVRALVDGRCLSRDRVPFDEFVFSSNGFQGTFVIRLEGWPSRLLLIASHELLIPILDRLLGGSGAGMGGADCQRGLTDLELRLATRVGELAVRSLQETADPNRPWNLSVDSVECELRLGPIVPQECVVAVHAFEILVGEARGTLRLCLPLDMQNALAGISPSETPGVPLPGERSRLVVSLGGTRLAARDLLDLAIGDTIVTMHSCQALWDVEVDCQLRYQGTPGVVDGHKAIRIREMPAEPGPTDVQLELQDDFPEFDS
jgi:flagellar motor switch protein FliM